MFFTFNEVNGYRNVIWQFSNQQEYLESQNQFL